MSSAITKLKWFVGTTFFTAFILPTAVAVVQAIATTPDDGFQRAWRDRLNMADIFSRTMQIWIQNYWPVCLMVVSLIGAIICFVPERWWRRKAAGDGTHEPANLQPESPRVADKGRRTEHGKAVIQSLIDKAPTTPAKRNESNSRRWFKECTLALQSLLRDPKDALDMAAILESLPKDDWRAVVDFGIAHLNSVKARVHSGSMRL